MLKYQVAVRLAVCQGWSGKKGAKTEEARVTSVEGRKCGQDDVDDKVGKGN